MENFREEVILRRILKKAFCVYFVKLLEATEPPVFLLKFTILTPGSITKIKSKSYEKSDSHPLF